MSRLESLLHKIKVKACAKRFWVERTFEDAKGSVGMANYQVRGWLAWHHHMAMAQLQRHRRAAAHLPSPSGLDSGSSRSEHRAKASEAMGGYRKCQTKGEAQRE
jgi:hypothetical protein